MQYYLTLVNFTLYHLWCTGVNLGQSEWNIRGRHRSSFRFCLKVLAHIFYYVYTHGNTLIDTEAINVAYSSIQNIRSYQRYSLAVSYEIRSENRLFLLLQLEQSQ